MRRSIIAGVALLAILASVPATAQRAKDEEEGVKVRRASIVRNLVPAASLEKAEGTGSSGGRDGSSLR